MEMMDNPHGRICNTGLSLGLCVVAPATATSAERSNHRRPGDPPCWPCISMASDAPPSLSLSLSSDDVHGEAAPLSSARSVVSRGASEEGEEDGGARKKLRLTREQSAMLEDRFKENSSLTPKQKKALAKQLNLRPRQVEVWFQNRRARTKLKQTAEDRGFLKKYFEMLTNENQRLQKELQELKSLKFSSNSSSSPPPPPPPPPLFMEIPAAALAMCPSCQRMASAGAGPSMALKSVFN